MALRAGSTTRFTKPLRAIPMIVATAVDCAWVVLD